MLDKSTISTITGFVIIFFLIAAGGVLGGALVWMTCVNILNDMRRRLQDIQAELQLMFPYKEVIRFEYPDMVTVSGPESPAADPSPSGPDTLAG